MVEIKVKKLHEDAKLPVKAKDGDSGYDVFALEDGKIRIDSEFGRHVMYRTGIAIEIPKGYEIQFRARSSIGTKSALMLANGIGTINW